MLEVKASSLICGAVLLAMLVPAGVRAGVSRGYSTTQTFSTIDAGDDLSDFQFVQSSAITPPPKNPLTKVPLHKKRDLAVKEVNVPSGAKKAKTFPEKTKYADPDRDLRRVTLLPERPDARVAVKLDFDSTVYSRTSYRKAEKDQHKDDQARRDPDHALKEAPKPKARHHGFGDWP